MNAQKTNTWSDRGQAAVILLIVVVALATALSSGLVQLGIVVGDRARAEAAADAAALAALGGGGAVEATRVAAANGSTLVSMVTGPGPNQVTVVVRVGQATARASATDEP